MHRQVGKFRLSLTRVLPPSGRRGTMTFRIADRFMVPCRVGHTEETGRKLVHTIGGMNRKALVHGYSSRMLRRRDERWLIESGV